MSHIVLKFLAHNISYMVYMNLFKMSINQVWILADENNCKNRWRFLCIIFGKLVFGAD